MNERIFELEQTAIFDIESWNAKFDQLVFANSLGAEDIVLANLLSKHSAKTRWFTLNTGRLHEVTVQLMDRVCEHFKTPLEQFKPQEQAVIQFVKLNGNFPMYESLPLRQACCHLRKLEPLKRALAGSQAWFTGLRREQSEHRQQVLLEEIDASGRYKLSPLANWTRQDVWDYIRLRQLPYSPLHDQGYPSIGCEPCTRAIRPDEPERAGRWWWEQGQKECGLHLKEQST
jgi:phosphoadenosine phosphosulfate reductase